MIHIGEEEKIVQQAARDFAQKELKPIASQIDKEHKIPDYILDKLKELGYFGIYMPEEYGGAQLSFLSYILVIEEISKACASTGVMLAVHNSLACASINMFGNEEQKNKYLSHLVNGEKIGCFMLTESEAGSDAANLATKVEDKGDHYLVNGEKIFVTNGGYQGIGVLFATHDRSLRHKGISAFILDLNTPGVNLLRNEKKMGLKGTYTSAFTLDNVKIPKENLLGKEKEGWKVAMHLLDASRVAIGAQALGIAQAAFEEALKYSQERKQFGRPLSDFEAIQFKLADMATRIEAARFLVYRAAWLKTTGKIPITEASMCKVFASETANYVTKEAIQIFGGYGYIEDYNVERMYRDARITEIYEGANEIQRLVIAKNLLK